MQTRIGEVIESTSTSFTAGAYELLAAVIRSAARARPGGERDYLVQAGRAVASLLKDDYDRLTAILRRIRP